MDTELKKAFLKTIMTIGFIYIAYSFLQLLNNIYHIYLQINKGIILLNEHGNEIVMESLLSDYIFKIFILLIILLALIAIILLIRLIIIIYNNKPNKKLKNTEIIMILIVILYNIFLYMMLFILLPKVPGASIGIYNSAYLICVAYQPELISLIFILTIILVSKYLLTSITNKEVAISTNENSSKKQLLKLIFIICLFLFIIFSCLFSFSCTYNKKEEFYCNEIDVIESTDAVAVEFSFINSTSKQKDIWLQVYYLRNNIEVHSFIHFTIDAYTEGGRRSYQLLDGDTLSYLMTQISFNEDDYIDLIEENGSKGLSLKSSIYLSLMILMFIGTVVPSILLIKDNKKQNMIEA